MNDKKSDRLGTMVFTIANELVNHFGKKLDRPVIDDITRNLTLEMCSGPTAWAFSGKDQPGQPSYDDAVAMVEYLIPVIDPMAFVAIRKADEFIARAKSVEVGHE